MRPGKTALVTCAVALAAVLTFVPHPAEGQVYWQPYGSGYWWEPYVGRTWYYNGPPWGYFGGPYASTAAEGYARGLADVIRARGEASKNRAEARLRFEETRTRYIENQRKWLTAYHEHKRLGLARRDERAAREREARQRYREMQSSLPRPTLAPDQLDSVTGRVAWPDLLRAPDYSEDRRTLDEQLVLLAHTGTISDVADAEHAIRRLQSQLKQSIREVRPQQYIESKSFLDGLFHLVRAYPTGIPVDSRTMPATISAADVPQLIGKLSMGDLAERHEAIVALGQLGPEAAPAVPALIDVLGEDSLILRHSALEALASIGVATEDVISIARRLLNDREPLVAVAAARFLVMHDKDNATTQAAIARLVDALASDDAHVRSEAAAALPAVGASAVADTVDAIRNGRALSSEATIALAGIGPDARAAVPSLLEALNAPEPDVRLRAVQALGMIGENPEQAVPAIAEKLADESESVRAHAALALGHYGPAAKPALASLTRALTDGSEQVRLAAARAIGEIGPDAAAAVPALITALDDPLGSVTLAAAESLGKIGQPAVPALIQQLGEAKHAALIAHVLGEIGPDASPAVPDLVRLLKTADEQLRREAILALASIGPDARSATSEILRLLRSPQEPLRSAAAYALAMIKAHEAVPDLRQTLQQADDPLLRLTSAWAITQLSDNETDLRLTVPVLAEGLASEDQQIQHRAAQALHQIGPQAKPAIPALIQALNTQDPAIRTELLGALADLGATQAVPDAIRLTEDPDVRVRCAAAYLLGKTKAEVAAAPLRRMLRSHDRFEQTVAAWALVQIDPSPENIEIAKPLLLDALSHERPDARREAALTLGRIAHSDPAVTEALRTLSNDEDPAVRQAAEQALRTSTNR